MEMCGYTDLTNQAHAIRRLKKNAAVKKVHRQCKNLITEIQKYKHLINSLAFKGAVRKTVDCSVLGSVANIFA